MSPRGQWHAPPGPAQASRPCMPYMADGAAWVVLPICSVATTTARDHQLEALRICIVAQLPPTPSTRSRIVLDGVLAKHNPTHTELV